MTIQLNTDNNLTASVGLSQRVEDTLTLSLDRFASQITRLDVHLSDENSSEKRGQNDKRCVLEARLPGHDPLVVTHNASTVEQAVDGSADRLKRLLAQTMDRRKDHR